MIPVGDALKLPSPNDGIVYPCNIWKKLALPKPPSTLPTIHHPPVSPVTGQSDRQGYKELLLDTEIATALR